MLIISFLINEVMRSNFFRECDVVVASGRLSVFFELNRVRFVELGAIVNHTHHEMVVNPQECKYHATHHSSDFS
jgi:hypothetical protein